MADLVFYKSASTWTTNGNFYYIGGAIGTALVSGTDYVFGKVPTYNAYARHYLYTSLYIKNDHLTRTFTGIKISLTGGTYSSYELAKASVGTNTAMATTANPYITPVISGSWTTGLDLAGVTLAPGQYQGFYIRRRAKATTHGALSRAEGDIVLNYVAGYTG